MFLKKSQTICYRAVLHNFALFGFRELLKMLNKRQTLILFFFFFFKLNIIHSIFQFFFYSNINRKMFKEIVLFFPTATSVTISLRVG